jgi:hypothetical protein
MIASELLSSMYILPRHLEMERNMLSPSLSVHFIRQVFRDLVGEADRSLTFSIPTCTLLHKAHQYQYRTHLTGDKVQLGK